MLTDLTIYHSVHHVPEPVYPTKTIRVTIMFRACYVHDMRVCMDVHDLTALYVNLCVSAC